MKDSRAFTRFHAELLFRDGISASVCGFCIAGRQRAVEDCFSALSQAEFRPPEDGLLIDRRFARLLAEAAERERHSILLTAGCVRAPSKDGPCGAVLGDLFAPPQSAPEGNPALTLPDGTRLHLLLRPGVGGAAFSCDSDRAAALFRHLEGHFPHPAALERLRREADSFLWATDYQPGHPLLDGRCHAHCKNA